MAACVYIVLWDVCACVMKGECLVLRALVDGRSRLYVHIQAMPGGKVVVFTGLKQCVTTEEELAAVVSACACIIVRFIPH